MEAATKQIEERKKQLSFTSPVTVILYSNPQILDQKQINIWHFFNIQPFITLNYWPIFWHCLLSFLTITGWWITASWCCCWWSLVYWPLSGCQLYEWCHRESPQSSWASGPDPVPVSSEAWYPQHFCEHGASKLSHSC